MPLGRPLYDPTRDTRLAGLRRDVEMLKRRAIPDPAVVGVAAEALMLDSKASAGVTSSTVLLAGQQYLITVQGTYSVWNAALEHGTPEADAMFPSSGSRASTQVGLDAECSFAYHDMGTGFTLGHEPTLFKIDLGSGYAHIEPDDGSHATPAAGHQYSYTVTGQGSPVSLKIDETGSYSDNYGEFRIIIQSLDPSSGGGGGGTGSGTLVPPPGTNGNILTVVSGIAAWLAPLIPSVFGRTGAVVAANGDYAGIVAAFLAGATQAARFVGATASGAPVSGTFLKGDFVVAQNGHIFVCTTAGSPGTWTDVGGTGGGSSPLTTKGDVYTHDAAADARLGVGADNTVLTADAAQTTGIKWVKVGEAMLALSDVTTANVSSTAHGFAPKSPADATKFLNGAATPAYAQVKDSDLSTSDITTNDVSTTKHGFTPKAPNDASKFLRGDATWAVATVDGGSA